MLARFSILGTCVRSGQVRGQIGEAIHGWIFSQLKDYDENIADKWHDSAVKPFSVRIHNNLMKSKLISTFDEGMEVEIEICTATEESFQVIHSVLVNKTILRLGSTYLQINSAICDCQISYMKLIEQSFQKNISKKVLVQFLSPTSFRREGIQILIPTSELVFEGLYRRFTQLCSHPFPPINFDVGHSIVITKHSIQSLAVPFAKYSVHGFVGFVEFSVIRRNEKFALAFMHTLLHFATYMGVGYKSTMGLGQIQLK